MMRTGAFTLGQFGLWKAFDQVSIRGSAELELGLRQGFELEGNLQYSRASAKLGLGLGVGHWHVLGLGGILEAAFDLASALPSGRAQTIQEGKHRIDALARIIQAEYNTIMMQNTPAIAKYARELTGNLITRVCFMTAVVLLRDQSGVHSLLFLCPMPHISASGLFTPLPTLP